MIALPKPDVRYRIQSDDFDTFLELYDTNDSSIVPRLAQRDSLLQQWIFVPSGASYDILNAATQSLPLPRYLILPSPGAVLGAGQAEAVTEPDKTWNVKVVEGHSFTLSLPIPDLVDYETFLVMSGFYGETNGEKVQVPSSEIQPRRRRWRISEVNPTIPDGKYYIHLFDGRALHCNQVTNLQISMAVLKLNDENRNFVWEIQSLGNGKCTIMNLSGKVYLGCEPSTVEGEQDQVAKSTSPTLWFLHSLGHNSYSITREDLSDVKASDPISLICNNKGEVILLNKTANVTAWVFEAVDIDASRPDERPPIVENATRFPEIIDRKYYQIQCAGSKLFIGSADNPWRFAPSERINTFFIAYQGDNACFSIAFIAGKQFFNLDGNTVVANDFHKTLWYLEREVDPAGGFRYAICLNSNPEMALTGELKTGLNGYESYVVVKKEKWNLNQLWKLTAIL